jgi:hypothetical protein
MPPAAVTSTTPPLAVLVGVEGEAEVGVEGEAEVGAEGEVEVGGKVEWGAGVVEVEGGVELAGTQATSTPAAFQLPPAGDAASRSSVGLCWMKTWVGSFTVPSLSGFTPRS